MDGEVDFAHHTEIKEGLIRATQIYYDYLDSHNLGCEELKVDAIECRNDSEVVMQIQARSINTDYLILAIRDKYIPIEPENGLEAEYYNEKTSQLKLNILDSALYNEICEYSKEVRILSDLKFLIKRLEVFFATSTTFALPSRTKPIHHILPIYLNAEQKKAIENILQNPISYIWGPPGSGKTQVVLFESLLYYIYIGKPVCVVAPTNNALEQVLRALIKKFDALELNREKILRLGTPTSSFLESFAEICDPKVILKNQKHNLFTLNTPKDLSSRLKEALVIGMTMDHFIAKYKELGIHFHHIFLDECAFTSLIKAATFCTQSAPITLLGDHKQLMPICEMPLQEIKDEKKFVNLFNLSSLFLEDLFLESLHKDSKILSKTQCAPLKFQKISSTNLLKTHRYGDNLARILDKHIYHNGLSGNGTHSELYYIDCGKSVLEDKSSLTEAKMIAHIFPYFKNDNIAIITPFIKQRKLIHEEGVPSRYIWTIHKSQGQEFDTVIFSPVMLHYHLTNSANPNAAYALNVAISRIKRRLIVVCDYSYWLQIPNQLLSDILAQAKPFSFDSISQAKGIEVVEI